MSREFWATVSVGIAVITVTLTGFAILSGRINAMENRLDARISSVQSSLRADITAIDGRLVAIESRMHEMNTRLSRIEGRLGLPDDLEPESEP